MRSLEEKEKLLKGLRRIEGQIRGIHSMIEDERYCIDILIQIQAARAALTTIGLAVLENHAKGCVVGAVKYGDDAIIDELLDTIKKFVR